MKEGSTPTNTVATNHVETLNTEDAVSDTKGQSFTFPLKLNSHM